MKTTEQALDHKRLNVVQRHQLVELQNGRITLDLELQVDNGGTGAEKLHRQLHRIAQGFATHRGVTEKAVR